MQKRRLPMHEHVPLLAVLLLFTVHLLGIALFNIYELWPPFDIVTHFFGGFAIGLLALHIHDRVAVQHGVTQWRRWYELLFVMSFVMFVAVLWEFHEYILDAFVTNFYLIGQSQISLRDTMGDLLVGWMGGVTAHLLRNPFARFGVWLHRKRRT